VYYRERAASYYRPEAYSVGLIVQSVPWVALYTFVYVAISYFLTGLRTDAGAFFTYLVAFFVEALTYNTMGLLAAALFPSAEVASILIGIYITLGNLFGGIVVPVREQPSHSAWFYYTNPVAHAVRLAALSQYTPADTRVIAIADRQTTSTVYEYAVQRLGMDYGRRWEALGWGGFILAVYVTAAILVHRYVNHQKR
jgi:hypothetical protein